MLYCALEILIAILIWLSLPQGNSRKNFLCVIKTLTKKYK